MLPVRLRLALLLLVATGGGGAWVCRIVSSAGRGEALTVGNGCGLRGACVIVSIGGVRALAIGQGDDAIPNAGR